MNDPSSPLDSDGNSPTPGLPHPEPRKVPPSIWLAIACWSIVEFFSIRGLWNCVRTGQVDLLVFFLAVVVVVGLLIRGLYRGSAIGWWWSRYFAALLGTLALAPFLFALATVVYLWFGGEIAAEMSYVTKVMMVVGVYALIPAAIAGITLVSLRTTSAKQHCQVTAELEKKLKAPIQLLWNKLKRDKHV